MGTGRWGRGGWWAEGGGENKVLGTGGAGQAIPGCFGHSHTRRLRRQPQTWERCH